MLQEGTYTHPYPRLWMWNNDFNQKGTASKEASAPPRGLRGDFCAAVLSAHTCIARLRKEGITHRSEELPGAAIRAPRADRETWGGPQTPRCGTLSGVLSPAVTGQGEGGRGPRRRWVWWEALLLQWLSCWHAGPNQVSEPVRAICTSAALSLLVTVNLFSPTFCRMKGRPSLPLWSPPYRLHFWNKRVNPISVISPNSLPA